MNTGIGSGDIDRMNVQFSVLMTKIFVQLGAIWNDLGSLATGSGRSDRDRVGRPWNLNSECLDKQLMTFLTKSDYFQISISPSGAGQLSEIVLQIYVENSQKF